MPLSNQQQDAVLVMEWMLSDEHRRTGRTFAQAVALIRLAARNPGTRFSCYDHVTLNYGNTRDANRNLVQQVRDLVEQDPTLSVRVRWHDYTFWFQTMPPIEDWWPRDSIPLPSSITENQVESLFDSITKIRKTPLVAPAPAEGPSRWACL